MKIRKILLFSLVLVILLSIPLNFKLVPNLNSDAYADSVEYIYAPDGRSMCIYQSELDTYLKLGWYKTREETIKTIYAPDGRTIDIYLSELDTYLKLGWYKSYEEVTKTIAAPDGRTMVVYLSEFDTYLNLGWSLYIPVDPSKPMVALSFDDGPSPYYTKRIVDTLAKHNASATFFVVGRSLASYSYVTKYALKYGMEIGNHSYTHANLGKSTVSKVQSEISSTTNTIINTLGVTPTLLRPPYGSLGENLKNNSPYPMILWSIDTLDWKYRNANSVYNKVFGKVKDGDIILMHDLYKTTADAVDMIVPYLKSQGFQIVNVSTLAKSRGYTPAAGQSYHSFR